MAHQKYTFKTTQQRCPFIQIMTFLLKITHWLEVSHLQRCVHGLMDSCHLVPLCPRDGSADNSKTRQHPPQWPWWINSTTGNWKNMYFSFWSELSLELVRGKHSLRISLSRCIIVNFTTSLITAVIKLHHENIILLHFTSCTSKKPSKFRGYWQPPLHIIIHNGAIQWFTNIYTLQSFCPDA